MRGREGPSFAIAHRCPLDAGQIEALRRVARFRILIGLLEGAMDVAE